MRRPMLSVDEIVEHMEKKGITFTLTSAIDAKRHLKCHNNYFKLQSYRKNYTHVTTGKRAGQYENLEFEYLVELSRLDTELREILLHMCLDIEHFLKVSLISAIEMEGNNGEDGYKVVQNYLFDVGNDSISKRAVASKKRCSDFNRIIQNNKNPYCAGLIKKYSDEIPVWAFVELLSFKELIEFSKYFSGQSGWSLPLDEISIDKVRQVRNACAHGNCLINDLRPVKNDGGKKGKSDAPKYITDFVRKTGVNKSAYSKKLSNPRILQFVHLIYTYDQIVTTGSTRIRRLAELERFICVRTKEHREYFVNNTMLSSTQQFFEKIITALE